MGFEVPNKTRTTKVEHKAPGMCGQVYVLLRICLDRPTYRQSKIYKDEFRVHSTWLTYFVSISMLNFFV